MRTTRALVLKSTWRRASATKNRAASFSRGATASSRSRITASAPNTPAFCSIAGLLPGTNSIERNTSSMSIHLPGQTGPFHSRLGPGSQRIFQRSPVHDFQLHIADAILL